ncbi:predicted transcriptional regulator, Cro/CI family [Desulfobacula toluolica Tol2]|uniref:Predicted transcriptional regulator, Cro/CI family n=2 Tax=Desulfobacula toluolica TaxID=28223 RepID=K0NMF5_DESTT|nr:predicted transcriptional regulator, Cro/CI family [Desulfobacula toluolica Tol2]
MQDMDDFIIEQLKENPGLIPDLLRDTLQDLNSEDDNFKSLMKTIFYITKSKDGGVSELARKTGLTRQSLYRMFKKGNPTLKTLVSILNGLGVRLEIKAIHG